MIIEKETFLHTELGLILLDGEVTIKEKVELFPSVNAITPDGQIQTYLFIFHLNLDAKTRLHM